MILFINFFFSVFFSFAFTASQNELNPSNHLKPEEIMSPKQKHQATSPNLPLTETTINEDEVRLIKFQISSTI